MSGCVESSKYLLAVTVKLLLLCMCLVLSSTARKVDLTGSPHLTEAGEATGEPFGITPWTNDHS